MKKQILNQPKRIMFTKDGYQKILDEKSKLLSQRPEAVDHLKKARDMGDLSENGYYKASRAKLSSLDARLRHLERLIRLARVVESSHQGIIDIGSTVTISDGTNKFVYSVVGGYESDPSKGTISHNSPIGRALMGRKVGDTIVVKAPSGEQTFTILLIA